MSFTIKCNQCQTEQELKEMVDCYKIIMDIANENFDDPEYDYIVVTCQNCSNEIEI